ncbi:hypothetical protein P5V15_014050 [Pogonomyrmex californicus]
MRNTKVYFSGYHTHTHILNDRGNNGGVAIVINKSINFNIIKKDILITHQAFDIIGIMIKNFSRKFNLIAVYRKPSNVNIKAHCTYIKY